MHRTALSFCVLLAFAPAARGAEWFVSTTGSDTAGNGSIAQPFRTVSHVVDPANDIVQAGDTVRVFPSGQTAVVAEVRRAGETVDRCEAGQSAGLVLDRQLDVSRGDWIGSAGPDGSGTLAAEQRFAATLAWLDTEPAQVGRKYWVRHGHRWVQARITAIDSRRDIHTLEDTDAHELAVNEIGRVQVETQSPLPVEAPAGTVVVRAGDHGDRYYLVAEGRVRVEPVEAEATTLGPGEGFGEIALLRDVPRTATVTALEDCRLHALERDDFLAAVTGSAPSLAAAHEVISTRLAAGPLAPDTP